MDGRYPAPHAELIWSDESRADRLREITDGYTIDLLLQYPNNTGAARGSDIALIKDAPPVSLTHWADAETEHGHEIVGFLEAYLARLPRNLHQYVHYGLTSSDLVEYDLHQALYAHSQSMAVLLAHLESTLGSLAEEHKFTIRAGRTHGQIAELTRLGHQFGVFEQHLDRIRLAMDLAIPERLAKTPGPVGFSENRDPLAGTEAVLSTQIIPRDFLLSWAAVYLRVANFLDSLATFIRLGSRSEVGEFSEGRAKDRQGSSAMPGKRNPIESERICGLARVARGYFTSLAQISGLWEDRDLSNSSTERIAVPGLASTVEYMTTTMGRVIEHLEVHADQIEMNARHPRTRANRIQNEIQANRKVGPIEASRIAVEWMEKSK